MQTQHPAIARAATLQARFWAHAPKIAPPVAEADTTPATQLEVETLAAEYDYLEFNAHLSAHPEDATDAAFDQLDELWANYNCLLAQLEAQK